MELPRSCGYRSVFLPSRFTSFDLLPSSHSLCPVMRADTADAAHGCGSPRTAISPFPRLSVHSAVILRCDAHQTAVASCSAGPMWCMRSDLQGRLGGGCFGEGQEEARLLRLLLCLLALPFSFLMPTLSHRSSVVRRTHTRHVPDCCRTRRCVVLARMCRPQPTYFNRYHSHCACVASASAACSQHGAGHQWHGDGAGAFFASQPAATSGVSHAGFASSASLIVGKISFYDPAVRAKK